MPGPVSTPLTLCIGGERRERTTALLISDICRAGWSWSGEARGEGCGG